MKFNKPFLFAILSTLAMSFMVGCSRAEESSKKPSGSEEEKKPLEIGDTVKEWTCSDDYEELPLDVAEGGTGERKIANDFGCGDKESLYFNIKSNSAYLTTEIEKPYFTENDGKNGDIMSMYVYVPENSNIKSLQLEVRSTGSNSGWGASADVVQAKEVEITAEKEEKWFRLEQSFDSLYTLGSIRLNFVPVASSDPIEIYVDDINITLGAETVKTDYSFDNESLWETYEDYFKVGCCMSADMLRNTEMRKIAKDQFNSITAENEAKPEQILDQEACQALKDKTQVAITMKPFEKLYDFCEANHIGVRHHTFVWYSQTPGWFFTEDYNNGPQVDRATMLLRMENFIKVTLESINDRWPGLVYAIDVANEALQQTNIRSGNNKWYDTVGDKGNGDNFVYYACKYAYEYKEDYQDIYYNDYEYDYHSEYCEYALNTLLKKAIAEKVIDGVGIQGHIDCDNIRHDIENAKLISAKGLKCQITELDITTNTNDEGYAKQKTAYKDFVKTILELNEEGTTNVDALVVWGITDDLSWKRGQDPLLFTSSFKKKPAYYGFLEAIDEADI